MSPSCFWIQPWSSAELVCYFSLEWLPGLLSSQFELCVLQLSPGSTQSSSRRGNTTKFQVGIIIFVLTTSISPVIALLIGCVIDQNYVGKNILLYKEFNYCWLGSSNLSSLVPWRSEINLRFFGPHSNGVWMVIISVNCGTVHCGWRCKANLTQSITRTVQLCRTGHHFLSS